MNLLQSIRILEQTAVLQPGVNSIVRNDVFRLNETPEAKYGVFAWLQGQHSTSADGSLVTYNFTLFYVDRLNADHSNEIQIQSVGMETLENVIRRVEEMGLFATDYTFQTFNQRFADDCAGVFCNVSFEAAKDGLCPAAYSFIEDGGSFNISFDYSYRVGAYRTRGKTVIIF